MSKWLTEKKVVLDAARQASEMGLVVGTAGNFSLRLGENGRRGLLAITPTSRYYDTLTVDDIVVIDFEGQRVEGELTPSVEAKMHIGIYKVRRKVNAVNHIHPVFASVFAVTGQEIPPIIDDQVTYLGGHIKLAKYAISGTDEIVENVVSALGPNNAVILAHHGAVCVGRDMREALTNCEMLEKTARIYLYALSVGQVTPFPQQAYELEKAFFDYHHGESE
jgi:L-fuculose-phosphate aldolase